MRAKLLVNDVHLGVQRTSGTTLATAQGIRDYLAASLRELIMQHTDKDLVINGDLFDTFSVSGHDMYTAYSMLREWLNAGVFYKGTEIVGPKLFLGRGNHDAAKDSSKLSSFDFIGRLLALEGKGRVVVVDEPQAIDDFIYMIPHLANQDLFNLALEQIPAEAKMVLVHANYDNHFAIEADHSLNVSIEQAQRIIDNGATLIFGHEHQGRTELGGGVIVTGNQWPSSVADCQHNPGNVKFAHLIAEDDDSKRLGLIPILTWGGEGDAGNTDFVDADWQTLDEIPDTVRFIRVSGTATAEQSADMVATLAKFRKESSALVITNAVKIAGVNDVEELTASMEEMQGFDVMGYLFEQLEPDQVAVVKRLQAEKAAA